MSKKITDERAESAKWYIKNTCRDRQDLIDGYKQSHPKCNDITAWRYADRIIASQIKDSVKLIERYKKQKIEEHSNASKTSTSNPYSNNYATA